MTTTAMSLRANRVKSKNSPFVVTVDDGPTLTVDGTSPKWTKTHVRVDVSPQTAEEIAAAQDSCLEAVAGRAAEWFRDSSFVPDDNTVQVVSIAKKGEAMRARFLVVDGDVDVSDADAVRFVAKVIQIIVTDHSVRLGWRLLNDPAVATDGAEADAVAADVADAVPPVVADAPFSTDPAWIVAATDENYEEPVQRRVLKRTTRLARRSDAALERVHRELSELSSSSIDERVDWLLQHKLY